MGGCESEGRTGGGERGREIRYSVLQYSLPLSAEKHDESNAADERGSAAQRSNDGKSHEMAHWSRLQFLQLNTKKHVPAGGARLSKCLFFFNLKLCV